MLCDRANVENRRNDFIKNIFVIFKIWLVTWLNMLLGGRSALKFDGTFADPRKTVTNLTQNRWPADLLSSDLFSSAADRRKKRDCRRWRLLRRRRRAPVACRVFPPCARSSVTSWTVTSRARGSRSSVRDHPRRRLRRRQRRWSKNVLFDVVLRACWTKPVSTLQNATSRFALSQLRRPVWLLRTDQNFGRISISPVEIRLHQNFGRILRPWRGLNDPRD